MISRNMFGEKSSKIKNMHYTKTRRMILFDNEWTMYSAYRFLYSRKEFGSIRKVVLEKLLQSVCIFKKDIVARVEQLSNHKNPGTFLLSYATQTEPLLPYLMEWSLKPDSMDLFLTKFQERTFAALMWVKACRNLQV